MSQGMQSSPSGADIVAPGETAPRRRWGPDVLRHRSLVAGLLTAIGLILHGLLRNRRFYSGLKH